MPERGSSPESKYTHFEPFNHGTTTIAYEGVSPEMSRLATGVLRDGWGIVPDSIQKVREVEEASWNFKIESEGRKYHFKRSHLTEPAFQGLVHDTAEYFAANGIPVSKPVSTLDGASYHESDRIYCLYEFIEGEHFDGSRQQLRSAAEAIAAFHKVSDKMPLELRLRNRIRRDDLFSRGELTAHDDEFLKMVLVLAHEKGARDDYEQIIIANASELLERSRSVKEVRQHLENLPRLATHRDLHPHNLLFDPDTSQVRGFVYLDMLVDSQRARDVFFAMHRLSRTYGESTERKNDIGADIRDRARDFILAYMQNGQFTEAERGLASTVLTDETLHRLCISLTSHYVVGNQLFDFDVNKQITMLREADIFAPQN